MFELLAAGGVLFWVLIGTELALLFWFMYMELTWRIPTVTVVLLAAGLQFLCGVPIAQWIYHNPLLVVGIVFGWGLVGAIWATIKWWLFVHDNRGRYDELFAKFCQSQDINGKELNDEQQVDWQSYLNTHSGDWDDGEYRRVVAHPMPAAHKPRIKVWIAYWPVSVLWTLLRDPLTKMVSAIYNRIVITLENISNKAWAGTEHHLPSRETTLTVQRKREAEREREIRERQDQNRRQTG